MKRKGNLYQNLYKFENIQSAFNEVCKNTKNKKKVARFKEYKCIYISRIYDILQTKTYRPGPYNVFTIYEPKKRRIKDKDALKIIFDIIDIEENGLSIGAMTSQILAIFYLNDMDHFIKETLKIKYFLRYQDDFLLFHPSKQYLKYCLNELEKFLKKEKLILNKKTRIYKSTNKFIFLGRKPNGNYAKFRDVRRKIKKRVYLYKTGQIELSSLISSIICYKHLCKKGSNY